MERYFASLAATSNVIWLLDQHWPDKKQMAVNALSQLPTNQIDKSDFDYDFPAYKVAKDHSMSDFNV